jgi:AcrR family transcriptional regulator
MSRDPRLASPGRSSAVPAGGHLGGRQLEARPEAGPPGGGQRQPLPGNPRSRDATTADRSSGTAGRTDGRPADGARPHRPSLGGGIPAKQRGLGAQGRETVRRLLDAGLAEFEVTGLQASRVEDIVRRAKTSHGTFYLYFSNKDDLFHTLLQDALHDMAVITDDFPVVTGNEAGRTALRRWVESFSETYAAHATVLRILTQAEIVGEDVYADGLQQLFRLSEVMTQGMTAAQKLEGTAEGNTPAPHAELTAVACLMMLERVNYLFSAEVRMPRDEMNDRLAAIIYAAFRSP